MSANTQELTAAAFAAFYVTVDPDAGRLSRYDRNLFENVAIDSDRSTDNERAARLLSQGYIRPGYPWRAPVALVLEPRGGRGDCVLPNLAHPRFFDTDSASFYSVKETPLGRLWAENQGGGVVAVLREGPRDRAEAPAPSFRCAMLDVMAAQYRSRTACKASR